MVIMNCAHSGTISALSAHIYLLQTSGFTVEQGLSDWWQGRGTLSGGGIRRIQEDRWMTSHWGHHNPSHLGVQRRCTAPSENSSSSCEDHLKLCGSCESENKKHTVWRWEAVKPSTLLPNSSNLSACFTSSPPPRSLTVSLQIPSSAPQMAHTTCISISPGSHLYTDTGGMVTHC